MLLLSVFLHLREHLLFFLNDCLQRLYLLKIIVIILYTGHTITFEFWALRIVIAMILVDPVWVHVLLLLHGR